MAGKRDRVSNMAESGKIKSNSVQDSRTTSERLVSWGGRVVRVISKKEADAKIDKLTAPKRGSSKTYDLPNGFKVNVVHRGVNGDVNEFYVTTSKNGETRNGAYYAQYLKNGGYAGPYSMVSSSKEEAFDNVKKWMKGLIK